MGCEAQWEYLSFNFSNRSLSHIRPSINIYFMNEYCQFNCNVNPDSGRPQLLTSGPNNIVRCCKMLRIVLDTESFI